MKLLKTLEIDDLAILIYAEGAGYTVKTFHLANVQEYLSREQIIEIYGEDFDLGE